MAGASNIALIGTVPTDVIVIRGTPSLDSSTVKVTLIFLLISSKPIRLKLIKLWFSHKVFSRIRYPGCLYFSSAVCGFCQVCVGLRPTPKIPTAREKKLWYPETHEVQTEESEIYKILKFACLWGVDTANQKTPKFTKKYMDVRTLSGNP